MLPVYVDAFMNGNKSVSLCKNIPSINKLYPNQSTGVYIYFILSDYIDLQS